MNPVSRALLIPTQSGHSRIVLLSTLAVILFFNPHFSVRSFPFARFTFLLALPLLAKTFCSALMKQDSENVAQSKEIKAVIFDMDGVIVDSEPRHERAFLEVVREIGYGDNHGIQFSKFVGRTDRELWVDFVTRHQPSHSLEDLLAMKRERVL